MAIGQSRRRLEAISYTPARCQLHGTNFADNSSCWRIIMKFTCNSLTKFRVWHSNFSKFYFLNFLKTFLNVIINIVWTSQLYGAAVNFSETDYISSIRLLSDYRPTATSLAEFFDIINPRLHITHQPRPLWKVQATYRGQSKFWESYMVLIYYSSQRCWRDDVTYSLIGHCMYIPNASWCDVKSTGLAERRRLKPQGHDCGKFVLLAVKSAYTTSLHDHRDYCVWYAYRLGRQALRPWREIHRSLPPAAGYDVSDVNSGPTRISWDKDMCGQRPICFQGPGQGQWLPSRTWPTKFNDLQLVT